MTYFELTDEDALRLFVCDSQIGSTNVDFQSEQYVYKRKKDGNFLLDLLIIIFRYSSYQH